MTAGRAEAFFGVEGEGEPQPETVYRSKSGNTVTDAQGREHKMTSPRKDTSEHKDKEATFWPRRRSLAVEQARRRGHVMHTAPGHVMQHTLSVEQERRRRAGGT